MSGSNPFEIDLDKNPANYAPLTPLGFIERAAYVYPARTAVVMTEESFERIRAISARVRSSGTTRSTWWRRTSTSSI